jgi:hypothetical protein
MNAQTSNRNIGLKPRSTRSDEVGCIFRNFLLNARQAKVLPFSIDQIEKDVEARSKKKIANP